MTASILVVDDTPDNLRMLMGVLAQHGYEVRLAHSGDLALRSVQAILPDLILLDIKMPDLDGYQVCEQLKADDYTRDIPVIFLSALDEAIDKVKGFGLGAVDYITKPCQAEEVIARVETHLSLRNLHKQLEEQNTRLQQEIAERKKVEAALQKAHDELEMRVEQRTAELAKAKEEALEAKETAEVANLAKSNFLRSISHELRTPLNGILGFSQILEAQSFGPLNEKQARYVERVIESGQHLLSLIEDVLDLSQIDLGKMELRLSELPLKPLLENSLATIREKDLREDLFLTLSISRELEDATIIADAQKLKQIMFNLLSNAVKFSPNGGTIVVDTEQDGDNLIISVIDSGIGIASEDQKKIFTNFYQVRAGLTDKTPGVGLGLPIVKRLVELHGGKIWVHSEGEGKGSRFSFSLPKRNF